MKVRFCLFAALALAVAAYGEVGFPVPEERIGFGRTLADFGVADVRTVHASDFGFDQTNATAAVQRAVDSDATTVVLDRMDSPWRLDTIEMRSGKRLLLAKGVKILCLAKGKPLVRLRGTRNVIIEGAGSERTFLAARASHAKSPAEERALVELDGTASTVIRGLRIGGSSGDGIRIGVAITRPSCDTWLENLELRGNAGRACAVCNARGVYARNVTFCGSAGDDSAGLSVDPDDIEKSVTTGLCLFDCRLNGTAAGLLFAANSREQIRFQAQRCVFGAPSDGSPIQLPARLGPYPVYRQPDARLHFEDCRVETRSNVPAVWMEGAPVYNILFCRVKFVDERKWSANRPRVRGSPVEVLLDRDFVDYENKEIGPREAVASKPVVFKEVAAEGFAGPFVAIRDILGKQSVGRAFWGKVRFNDKFVDTVQYVYRAPEVKLPNQELVHAMDLLPAPRGANDAPVGNCEVVSTAARFQRPPAYGYLFSAKKGEKVSFTVNYPAGDGRADWTARLKGARLMLDTSCGEVDLGKLAPGANRLAYCAAADGWCVFRPPCADVGGGGVTVTDVSGAKLSYQCDTLSGAQARIVLRNPRKEYVGYFEVPPSMRCVLCVTSGDVELRNANGKVVDVARAEEYGRELGRKTMQFQNKSPRPEVWSFRIPPGQKGVCTIRFQKPLNGVWADDPRRLPMMR